MVAYLSSLSGIFVILIQNVLDGSFFCNKKLIHLNLHAYQFIQYTQTLIQGEENNVRIIFGNMISLGVLSRPRSLKDVEALFLSQIYHRKAYFNI